MAQFLYGDTKSYDDNSRQKEKLRQMTTNKNNLNFHLFNYEIARE